LHIDIGSDGIENIVGVLLHCHRDIAGRVLSRRYVKVLNVTALIVRVGGVERNINRTRKHVNVRELSEICTVVAIAIQIDRGILIVDYRGGDCRIGALVVLAAETSLPARPLDYYLVG